MATSESIAEQLDEAIIACLLGIVEGDDFWLTPSQVIRRHEANHECLDDSLDTIYVLSPDRQEDTEEAVRQVEGRLFMTLTLMHRFDPASEEPFSMSKPHRWTWQERMLRDVRKAILADVSFGGLAINTELTEADLSAESTFAERWAIVLVRLMVTYRYRYSAP